MSSTLPALALKPSQSVKVAKNNDGAVLLDVQQGLCFSLNPIGLRIWELLSDNFTLQEMAEKIAGEYHVPLAAVLQDVADFTNSLRAKRLLITPQENRQPWWRRFSLA